MENEVDAFDFVLAEALGMSLTEVRALPNTEHEEWRAFYEWRRAMQEFEMKKRR